jgi:CheY-like chemotaxis protein
MSTTDVHTGAKTILIIDDDEDYVASVRAMLESDGFTVLEASSGKAGLEKLVEHRPDLVVLDVMMETTTEGYGVSEAIKYDERYQAYSAIPVIMVSSIQESPDELFPRAPEVDMIRPDRYLTKPLDVPRFLEVVRKALRHSPSR